MGIKVNFVLGVITLILIHYLGIKAEAQTVISTEPFPPTITNAGNASISVSQGDGYKLFHYGSKMLAMNHHGSPNLDNFVCYDRSISANCPGFPKRLPDGSSQNYSSSTSQISEHAIIDDGKFYYPVSRFTVPGQAHASDWGLGCYDLDTDQECGYSLLGSAGDQFKVAISGPFKVGNKAILLDMNMVAYCVDYTTMLTCGQIDLSLPANGGMPSYQREMSAYAGRINGEVVDDSVPSPYAGQVYFTVAYHPSEPDATMTTTTQHKRAICLRVSTMTPCWSSSQQITIDDAIYNHSNFLYHDSAGLPVSICTRNSNIACLSLANGADSSAAHSQFDSEVIAPRLDGGEVKVDDKTYFLQRGPGVGRVHCFDWSLQQNCDASVYPILSVVGDIRDYALSVDESNCIWSMGHRRNLWSVDPAEAHAPCRKGQFTRTLEKTCETRWNNIVITGLEPTDYSSLSIRVRDKTGSWVEHDILDAGTTMDLTGGDFSPLNELEYEIIGAMTSSSISPVPEVNVSTIDESECGCADCELCCPPWTQTQFENIYEWSYNGPNSYNVNYNSSAALDSQMNAWLTYAQTIRPDVASVNIWFYPTECLDNVATATPCPSSLNPFDINNATPAIMDYNMLQWTGSGVGVHWNVDDPGLNWTMSGTSLTRPFSTNRLYRITAVPMLVLNDGSFEFIGEGWFGNCPFGEMETNFQIEFKSVVRGSTNAPKIATRMMSPRQIKRSRDTRKMAKALENMVKLSKKVSEVKKLKWTPWINSDRPGGNGDFQTIKGLTKDGKLCANPVDIECRVAGIKTESHKTGETLTCDTVSGHLCSNKDQSDGRCEDYEVRFACPVK